MFFDQYDGNWFYCGEWVNAETIAPSLDCGLLTAGKTECDGEDEGCIFNTLLDSCALRTMENSLRELQLSQEDGALGKNS